MRASAKAQPNIALIKYWGKRDAKRNLPAVGSISITLADIFTTMSVEFDSALRRDLLVVNGTGNEAMLPRVSRCLDSVAGADRDSARVTSNSNWRTTRRTVSKHTTYSCRDRNSAATQKKIWPRRRQLSSRSLISIPALLVPTVRWLWY